MKTFCLIALLFMAWPTSGQIYAARTDVNPQAYPGTIPCPGSDCSVGGSLTGAGAIINPTDFSTTIVRVTDVNTVAPQRQFVTSCNGTAETNIMDQSDTRVVLCGVGQNYILFSFAAPSTFTELYNGTIVPDCGAGLGAGNVFFSFTQSHIAYGSNFNSSGSPVICRYDFASTTTAPTVANGKVTTLVDLSTCVGALSGTGSSKYLADVVVSGDDQTFATLASTTSGQGSSGAVYVIVWNRTLGCRVWETATGAVTGNYGGAPTGTVNIPDQFTLHNVRLAKSGTWVKVAAQTCLNALCPAATMSGGNYWWNIATLSVTRSANDSSAGCGHTAIGYNNWTNQCATAGHSTDFFVRTMTGAASAATTLPSIFAAGNYSRSGHLSWANDNSADTAPVFITTDNGSATFAVTNAWDNEILGLTIGTVFRFAHTYNTNRSSSFAIANSIGSVTADGKYFFWSTDWDGMLGRTDNVTTACTPGTNCRSDVFMALLKRDAVPPAPPTNLKITVVK